MPKLYRQTKRLTIRPLAPSDFKAWREAHLQMAPQRNEWDRSPRPASELTKETFSAVLKSQREMRVDDKFYDLGVFLDETGELIGSVACMDVIRGLAQSAFLGYCIFNRHWGNGYAKEAVRAMIEIAFKDLQLHRIEAGIGPRNRRSIFLARSLGLRKEGLKKGAVYLRGRWVDLAMYSATCEEFGYKWKGLPDHRIR